MWDFDIMVKKNSHANNTTLALTNNIYTKQKKDVYVKLTYLPPFLSFTKLPPSY